MKTVRLTAPGRVRRRVLAAVAAGLVSATALASAGWTAQTAAGTGARPAIHLADDGGVQVGYGSQDTPTP